MKRLLFKTLFLAFISCQSPPIQYPTTYGDKNFMEQSKAYNKALLKLESAYFDQYREEHPNFNFVKSDAGFYMSPTRMQGREAKPGDTVVYTYQIKDLQDSLYYNYKEIGLKKEVLGKAPLLVGVEYALKRMEPNEEATLLLPSALAYGASGDGDKISGNTPLVIEISLHKINNDEF